MRELKFRTWNGKMSYPIDNIFPEDSLIKDLRNYKSGNVIIQQYTGLLDKNGKEIYEGDIVKLFNDSDELYEVVYNCFDNDILGFLLESYGGRGDWFDSRKREVIGNIYENSELLK
jgi:uncharacterized phage protein (TIGR01671 family)